MYYVYVLRSRSFDELYIGSTNDLKRRLRDHNNGKHFSTRRYAPWKLVYYEAYCEEKLARLREKRLKQHGNAKRELKRRIGIQPTMILSADTQSKKVKSGAGLTLIELMTVLGMIVIIAAITAPSFASIKRGVGLNNTAQEIVSALRVAQNRAISSQRPVGNTADPINYGVHFSGSTYTLYYGNDWASAGAKEAHQLPDGTTVCPTSATDIIFNRLDGIAVSSGDVKIGIDCNGSTTRTITVAPSGTIQ